jgi:DNA-directed RNA polymerase subunit M/transcription elongation factor TFIIS
MQAGGGGTAGGDDPAATRAKVAARFAGALDGDAALARRLEVCLWNWTVTTCARDLGANALFWANPRFRYRYTTRALSLESNLRQPGNPRLRERVLRRELPVRAYVNMTPQEMWPERWEEAYAKVAAKQLRREADVDPRNAPDGAYTCGKCKSRKTVYTSIQIRSADEPMTNFVRCLNCGKSWKD